MKTGMDRSESEKDKTQRLLSRRWLSAGLIGAGLLLLIAGGVMAVMNAAMLSQPPPPAGLAENPLPVVVNGDFPDEPIYYATSTASVTPRPSALPSSFPTLSATEVAVSAAPPTPVPTPIPGSPPTPALTGPPVRIMAPAIGLDAPVVPVGWQRITQNDDTVRVWQVASHAAGWHEDSAMPGMEGNVVLSGHHNTAGEVFRYIVDLEPGDTVTLYTEDQPYTYSVETRFVVRDRGMPEETRRENGRWIGPYPDQRVTLVTCWPYNTNTHRVIVVARPAP
jgi:sortase A